MQNEDLLPVNREASHYKHQFARAQVSTPQGALMLGGFLHAGHTVSLHCVAKLVQVVEATVGRPRRRVELLEQRLTQTERELTMVDEQLSRGATGRREERLQQRQAALQEAVTHLRARREEMMAENASNPRPRRFTLRLDAGFGAAATLACLCEQGHPHAGTRFVARAHTQHVAQRCKSEEGLHWEKVSKNGFIAQSRQTTVTSYPYPLRVFACRQW